MTNRAKMTRSMERRVAEREQAKQAASTVEPEQVSWVDWIAEAMSRAVAMTPVEMELARAEMFTRIGRTE